MTSASSTSQPALCYQALNNENFPIFFSLAPKELREDLKVLYQFARSADNIADQPLQSAQQRRNILLSWQRTLFTREIQTDFWPSFYDLADKYELPLQECEKLLEAFIRDTSQTPTFTGHGQTLDYCRHSAIPIGRLLLSLTHSKCLMLRAKVDRLCIGLQLLNFYQDIADDYLSLKRCYLEHEDLERAGIKFEHLWSDPHQSWKCLKPLLIDRLSIYLNKDCLDQHDSWPLFCYALGTFNYALKAKAKLSASTTIFQKNKLAWYDLFSIIGSYCYDRSRLLSRHFKTL